MKIKKEENETDKTDKIKKSIKETYKRNYVR